MVDGLPKVYRRAQLVTVHSTRVYKFIYFTPNPAILGLMVPHYRYKIKRNNKTIASPEIEDSFESRVCKVCVILQPRVQWVLLGLMQDLHPVHEENTI